MPPLHQVRIGILGSGRIAQALGHLLANAGEPIVAVAGRDAARAHTAAIFISDTVTAVSPSELSQRANRILIATPDRVTGTAALTLANSGMNSGIVLHTSGILGPEILRPLAEKGVACGVLHPLQTVPSREAGVELLPGVTYGIAGSHAAQAWAEHLVEKLTGQVLVIPAGGTKLYHAAAVMASNAIVGVLDVASRLLETAGVERSRALLALQPLAEASVRNAVSLDTEGALTGPLERGDSATIEAHLEALENSPKHVTELYRSVGCQLLDIARRRGLSRTVTEELETILTGDKSDG